MYEPLKSLQNDMHQLKMVVGEVKQELNAIRGHMISMQSDTYNIHGMLSRQDDRVERTENSLELRELAKPRTPYTPS